MKQKILIFNYFMYLGGAERALLGLLNAIDYSRYDVDLFLAMHVGEFMKLIPKEVNLLPEDSRYAGYACPLKDVLFSKNFIIGLARLKAKLKFKKYMKHKGISQSDACFQYVVKEMLPYLPEINPIQVYDLAISFIAPHNIVAEKVQAKKKIAWIHTDYTNIDVNVDMELPVWSKFDYIVSISEDVGKMFGSVFPSLVDKLVDIENILSPSFVSEQAILLSAPEIENFDGLKIVSVGRICQAKNYDNVPYVAQLLKQRGMKFKWFIVGPGDHSIIDQTIAETDTADCIQFLGPKANPYPYIAACDIYLQPSRYEGNSVTVREAQMLCKPVIVTNYTTAPSQIQNGVDGIICPMENKGIANAIETLAKDKNKQNDISHFLLTHDYGNESEVEKIYELLTDD